MVCFPNGKDIDQVSSALSITEFFGKFGKQVDIVCSNYEPIKNIKYLKNFDKIKNNLSNLQKLILKVDLSHAKVETLSYDIRDNWLYIHLNPKTGSISKKDLRTAQTALKYDLIISIGAPDLNSLGDVFLNNTDLFYSVPIVNIDNKPGNEEFGQINFCDIKSVSNSEITHELIVKIDEDKLDKEVATAILTGMIWNTRSFKTGQVTPNILNKASDLIAMGANRDEIIKHLYQTKSIATLKLWGKALSRLKQDNSIGLVWTFLTAHDFAEINADKKDLDDIIEELIANSPEAKMTLLLHESEKDDLKICGTFTVNKEFDAKAILKKYQPIGNKQKVEFEIKNIRLVEAENEIVETIKKTV